MQAKGGGDVKCVDNAFIPVSGFLLSSLAYLFLRRMLARAESCHGDNENGLRFDPDRAEEECRSMNPDVSTIRLSAETSEGIDELVSFLEETRNRLLTGEQ